MSEKIVQLNEEFIKGQLKELVRGSVEETLNELLEKEAESLTQAARYERSEARQGYRSGHYDRNLTTTSGDARSICRSSRVCPSRRPSSSGIAAGRAAWRKPSGRRLRAPGGGHHGGVVGQQGFSSHHQRAEQESLRPHRGLAKPPLAGRTVSIRLRGRYLPAPQLGRRYEKVAVLVAIAVNEDGIEETLTYCDFPSEHRTRIRTNNVIERLNREIRRRTRVLGTFPDGSSALMLVCARLRHAAGTQWGCKKYMNMKHLEAALDDAPIAG